MKLLDSEGDAEVGCSERTSEGHGFITINMRANLDLIEMLLDDFGDKGNSAGTSDHFD